MKVIFTYFNVSFSIFATLILISCSTYKPPYQSETEQQGYFEGIENKKISAEIDYGTSSLLFLNDRYSGALPSDYSVNLKIFPVNWEKYNKTQSNELLSFYSFYFPLSFSKSSINNRINDSADKKVDIYGFSFGFAFRDGYSYKTGDKSRLDLYNSTGIILSGQGDYENDSLLKSISPKFQNFMDNMYGWSVNDIFESGMRYRFSPRFALNLNYESKILYPKILFWNWLLERTIETGFHFGLDFYIKEIFKQTPELIPVVNFVFNSAISYGFQELRTRNMNWTKETEPAFQMYHFTFGFTF
ncbi:MAG: hypothetical protein HW421_1188 [Ignavibacteria bacterium]|nr:hypothetical protein [Ignavibacteria bacterium]